ncbi:hypothetical protein LIER_31791 [Lithospermum erythrorhizon]|uniref:Uncharacterized protein n=1 Tax=Lithospermum erythrorhizon TaxID=34254 RepID=A0AAV3RS09_LITER
MVADLLIRLKQPSSTTATSSLHHPPPPLPSPPPPPLSWGQKQPRSTPLRKYSAKTTTSIRCSPRTPLSWSGGAATASPSDGGDDDCATPDPFYSSRSKNFSQLKEEETELLKERVDLKRDLESIHVNLNEQRNRSYNLKRVKLDLNQQSTEASALSTQPESLFPKHPSQMEASTANLHQSILQRHAIKEERASAISCGMQKVAEPNKRGFVVPDLNMPVGDDEIAAALW